MQKKINLMNYPRLFRWIMNCWPPYLGAGVCVEEISPDWKQVRVAMKLRWYNRNYVRSHFGGSLFSMTDPFLMLMLMANLGREYVVWDSSAKIKFIQPGLGKVTAHFHLDDDSVNSLREQAASGGKMLEKFRINVVDEFGSPVARVYKTLYIRKKTPQNSAK